MKATTVRMDDSVLGQLDALAEAQGRSRSWLINDAVARYLEHEAWFAEEVAKGIKAADAGDFVSDVEMKETFERWGVKSD